MNEIKDTLVAIRGFSETEKQKPRENFAGFFHSRLVAFGSLWSSFSVTLSTVEWSVS